MIARFGQFAAAFAAAEGAELFGIPDRGVLAPGAFADVNVIDLAALRLLTPELTRDFSLGAPRYVRRAAGYAYTLVGGAVFAEDSELTGDLPGRVVSRSGTRPGPAARPGSPAG